MPRRSGPSSYHHNPQARYWRAVREIARREDSTVKEARALYRSFRRESDKPLTAAAIKRVSEPHFHAVIEEARKAPADLILFEGEEFGFVLAQDHRQEWLDRLNERFGQETEFRLTIQVMQYYGGIAAATGPLSRYRTIIAQDVWDAYHEMLRAIIGENYDVSADQGEQLSLTTLSVRASALL